MKKVWVSGLIDNHHKHLRGGSTKSIPVQFVTEDGRREYLWVKANGVKWRK